MKVATRIIVIGQVAVELLINYDRHQVVNDVFSSSVFFAALPTVYSYLNTQRIDFNFLLCCTCMMYITYCDVRFSPFDICDFPLIRINF